jgi:putative hydrolase of the HAD superfamily
MKPNRLIVLDIDDTLYLERDYVRSGFAAVAAWARRELGIGGLADAAWAAFESGVRGTILDDALAACGVTPVPPGLIPRLVGVYRTHPPDIALLADARGWLDAVDGASGGSTAVAAVTDGPLASQQAKALALGLARWVDPIVFTEALGRGCGKPDPAAFELLERETGLRGDLCVYVADNPSKDFAGPHRLGWRTVRMRRPNGLHAGMPSGDDVDVEVDTFDRLDAALFGLRGTGTHRRPA